jgi:hypothetical protein
MCFHIRMAQKAKKTSKKKSKQLKKKDMRGFKHFRILAELTEHLHAAYIDPNHPNKRKLHYDQYLSLMLLYMFSPVCDSLRMIQQATELKKVQKIIGGPRFGRGTISEAGGVFDPELLKGVIGKLAEKVPDGPMGTLGRDDLDEIITLVDGSWLPGIVSMLWANFRHDGTGRKAAKAHVQFELAKGVPTAGKITDANTSEFSTLQDMLQSGRLYVLDRGYAKYDLLQSILEAKSDFVVRLHDNAVLEVEDERELSSEALEADVDRDAVIVLGRGKAKDKLKQSVRIVEIECKEYRKPSGKTGRGGPEQGDTILLCTSRLDLPPDVISTIYKKRWAIEIFFRFFKQILGCRHLIHQSENGLELQLYIAIIACMLIAIYTGRKPNKTVLKLVQLYLTGWATLEEVTRMIDRLPESKNPTA